jgi:hypothetical protein
LLRFLQLCEKIQPCGTGLAGDTQTGGGQTQLPGERRVYRVWEFDELRLRMPLVIACVAVAGLGGVALYAYGDAAPACDSDPALGQVYRVLRDQYHVEGVFLHDFTPVSGGWFSDPRDCAAEIAEIRGNVNAADLPWRQVRYRVTHSDSADRPVVTVDLGNATPFVGPPKQTLWTRLFAHF